MHTRTSTLPLSLLLGVLLLSAPLRADANDNADGDGRTSKIIGGAPASINNFPYQVVVHANVYLCAGSILNNQWILTAAHCTMDPNSKQPFSASQYQVGVGSNDVLGGTQYAVSTILVSANYDPNNIYNGADFALLKLSGTLSWSSSVQPLVLASPSDVGSIYGVGSQVVIAGWGETVSGQTSSQSRFLQHVFLQIISSASNLCPLPTPNAMNNYMCAYANNQDACQGDSGGALVARLTNGAYLQVGIVSFGVGCGQQAGAYTDVSKIRSVIEGFTGPLPTSTNPFPPSTQPPPPPTPIASPIPVPQAPTPPPQSPSPKSDSTALRCSLVSSLLALLLTLLLLL